MRTVVLIRHARPLISASWIGSGEFSEFLDRYESSSVEMDLISPMSFHDKPRVISSPSPRAQMTASSLFEAVPIETMTELREAELDRSFDLHVRLPSEVYVTCARIAWFLNFKGKVEPRCEFAARIDRVASAIVEASDSLIVIVAHGFTNRYLLRSLERRGGRRKERADFGYLGRVTLEFDSE